MSQKAVKSAAGRYRRERVVTSNSRVEQYKMPECLKELVDYKNSQDYLMFKQLHKQVNQQVV